MSKKRIAVYPGSFDPIHPGHLQIISQASALFDEVIVLIAENPAKNYVVSASVRAKFIIALTSEFTNVKVAITKSSVAKYCCDNDVDYVVRGLRNSTDLEYEFAQEFYTQQLAFPQLQLEYVYFRTSVNAVNCSSSAFKQFMQYSTYAQFRDLFISSGWMLRACDMDVVSAMYDVYRHGNYDMYIKLFN